MSNWTAPGPDGIPGYWLKGLPGLSEALREALMEVHEGKAETPEWLAKGRTVLIPKSEGAVEPDKFRPITCLNTTYKCTQEC